jgi:O-antigen/teichoic acid export membrane protein
VIIYIGRPFKVKPKFDKNAFKDLVKTGLPIYIFGYLDDISKTFSRTILLTFGTVLLVGYYSPAMAILTGIAMLPSAIGQYISPQMAFSLGKFNDAKRLWKWVWKSAFALILIGLPMVIIGWFAIPYFITAYFPNYVEGIFAAQFALIAGVLDSAGIGVNVLNSLKKFKWIGVLTITKLVLFWSLMYYFASILKPLEGVAIGLTIAQFIYFIMIMIVCYKVTKGFNLKKFKKEESSLDEI